MFDIATKVHRPGRPLMLVVSVGFLPLLAAPLVPYNTVGTLIAVILLMSGIMTILILVAFLKTCASRFFPMADARRTTTFNCGDALFAGITGMVFVAVTIHSMFAWERAYLPWFLAAASVPLLFALHACRKLRASHAESSGSGPTGTASDASG